MNLEKIKNDLEKFLLELGKFVEKKFENKNKKFSSKRHANDLLTKTDLKVNKLIINYLEKNYPEITIISEEAKEIDKNSEFAFIVDPIDGTRNFVRNIPIFHIGIGLVQNNKTIFCITYNPISKEMFWAIKGKGAFRNNKKIKVSNRTLDLSDVLIRISSKEKEKRKTITLNLINNVYQIKNNMCTHEEVSGIACDKYDGYISYGSNPWDHCHYLLIEEAGGKVTDWEGKNIDITEKYIIFSNGVIHEDLLKAIR